MDRAARAESGSPTPARLLLGPGPSNVPDRVLRAMARPLLGHLDPEFLALCDEVQAALRRLFTTGNPLTLPLSATGSGGMEACFANLVEPGDTVLVGVAGVFGERMCQVATRLSARVVRVEVEPGSPLDPGAMTASIRRHRPRVVALVHAETSTGVLQPVESILAAAREIEALTILDCVTSLGGLPVAVDPWGVDAAYSGTQKCLSCPPGLAPATFGERALARVRARRTPVPSWYFDLELLAGYYGADRVYHHTAPISAIYALHEGLRLVEEEGLEACIARHERAAARLRTGLERLGFRYPVPEGFRLPMLHAVELPEPVARAGEGSVRRRLLERHGIEVGAGLGRLAGRIWRIGLMGENAREEVVDRLLGALEEEIRGLGA